MSNKIEVLYESGLDKVNQYYKGMLALFWFSEETPEDVENRAIEAVFDRFSNIKISYGSEGRFEIDRHFDDE